MNAPLQAFTPNFTFLLRGLLCFTLFKMSSPLPIALLFTFFHSPYDFLDLSHFSWWWPESPFWSTGPRKAGL